MTGSAGDGQPTAKKVDPEELALRAKPRPVTRINRRALMVLCGTGLFLVLGATIFALDPPRLLNRNKTGSELYRTENTPKPDGLETLPRRYSDLPKKSVVLGPPLPGDLGEAILDTERELGIEPSTPLPFRSNPEDDAARAERIRQARLAQQGREAGVFFQLSTKGSGGRAQQEKANRTPPEPSRVLDLSEVLGAAPVKSPIDQTADQNLQQRKIDFANQDVDTNIHNAHALTDPVSPYQVMAGTVIAASLITGINSDLPGQVIAQVTENIYDTVIGNHLLIPQGSRVIGTYDSLVAYGQERALVVWQRIIMPDGSSILIENLPATDTAGYAGLEDGVDFHTWRLLKGIALSTLLGVGTELTFGDNESDLLAALRGSTQDSANQIGQRITERNLNVQPTITIRPGWPLRIIVNKDLILRPYRGVGAAR